MSTPALDLQHVAVVILNYNTRHLLEDFLPLVLQHSGNARVVVAANNSADGSAELVKSRFPQVQLVRIPDNLGFCAGYNYALARVNCDFYVLLNSDVEVTPGWLYPLVALLTLRPDVAACQPKIKAWHRKDTFEYAGAAGGLIDLLGYPFARGRLFNLLETDHGQYDDETEIFWATGACMCIRARLYHEFNGLDESFFAHMEEIDLCWRLKNAGHRIFYTGKSTVYHVGGGTLASQHPRKIFYNFRNGLYLLTKNLPAGVLLPTLFARMLLDGVAALRFLLQDRDAANFAAVLRAHMAWYCNLPALLKKRRVNTKKAPLSVRHTGMYRGSVVKEFFASKHKTVAGFYKMPSSQHTTNR